ncbi:hypothetical protein McanCB56680_001501 [Microsporum canis]
MSEAQKPVEETPAVVPATVPETTTEAPVVTEPAAETPAEEPVKAAEETPAAEEPKEETAAKEVVPATDGQLGYKAPGLVKSFRFVKRHFWFSEEAVESKQLTSYFQNEKLSVAHPNAAWASQTGKGLLFFAKRSEDKASPAGIINLSDISDVTKDGHNEFVFKLNGHKHTFQAATAEERDSWIAAIEAKSAEGKAAKEEIVGGEGYKSELEKFTKVPVVAAVAGTTKKVVDDATKAVESAVEPKEEKKDDKKSRSQSRKRASIFGNFLGKKEDQEEKKEEQKEEDKTEDKEAKKDDAEDAPAPVAAADEAGEPAATEAAETSAAAEPATDAPAEEPKPEEKKTETPVKSKRTSIFGNFFQKFPKEDQEKAKKEAVAETPAVSSTAPQLGDPVDASTSEPIKPETVTAPTEETAEKAEKTEEVTTPTSSNKFLSFMKKSEKTEKSVTETVEKKVEETVNKADETVTAAADAVVPGLKEKRRTSLFGTLGGKKEKKTEVEGETSEGETPKKTGSLSQLFRKPSKAVKKEKEPAVVPATETEPIAEEPSTEAPAATTEAVNGEEPKTTEAPASSEPAPVAASQPVPTAA